ncbi:hypothetical protein QTP88_011073 [Uroleucon formosanum]
MTETDLKKIPFFELLNLKAITPDNDYNDNDSSMAIVLNILVFITMHLNLINLNSSLLSKL